MHLLNSLGDYASVLLVIASFLMVPVAIYGVGTAFLSNAPSTSEEDNTQP